MSWNPFKLIDDLLNRITMYRLVLYCLIALLAIAAILGWMGILPYSGFAIVASALFLTAACLIVELIFAWGFERPRNIESAYITALILALIITPPHAWNDALYLSIAGWASVWAIASKYIFTINRRHLFNPAAFGVAVTALAFHQSASWWVGTGLMLPFVAIAGFLIVQKIERWHLTGSFWAIAIATTLIPYLTNLSRLGITAENIIVDSSLIFFGTVMLTEPATAPPTRTWRILYACLIGFLFIPTTHIGGIYFSPELALLVGNILTFFVTPEYNPELRLVSREKIAHDTYSLTFRTKKRFHFRPGQYMEWTMAHRDPDAKGNRRYFTLASSPTEDQISIGIKTYEPLSSFKKALLHLRPGEKIWAAGLAGDFVLPSNPKQPVVLIAGGIGITPYRSMIKDLLDRKERRPITLLYSNKTANDIAYKEIFDQAAKEMQIKVIYALTDTKTIAQDWEGNRGAITSQTIKETIPHYRQAIFYLSGPRGMVLAFEKTLAQMRIPKSQIKIDFFPGFV